MKASQAPGLLHVVGFCPRDR